MKLGTKLLYLACATVLASCGGGDSGDDGSPTPSAQQFPGGVWVSPNPPDPQFPQSDYIGVIDGGARGTGGIYYLARSTGGLGYDSLYGTLSVTGSSLRSTGATYFSTTDGKFATSGITVSGTVTGAAIDDKAGALISGNYSDPVGTTAATGKIVPFKLQYSADLYERPSRLDLIQGVYNGGGSFGPTWTLTVDNEGNLTGTNVGCMLTGKFTNTVNPERGIYSVSMRLTGDAESCAQPNSQQSGVAVLQYNSPTTALETKSGIWIFTTNQVGTRNTFVLNGVAAKDDSSLPPPATTHQLSEGIWSGAFSNGVKIDGIVTPDGDYVFYKKAGAGYDLLFGNMAVTDSTGDVNTSLFTSNDGMTYYSNANEGNLTTPAYTPGLELSGDVRTHSKLIGTYKDPTAANKSVMFTSLFNPTYNTKSVDVAQLAGDYTSSGGFGGVSLDLNVDATGAITGQSGQCGIKANLAPYSVSPRVNLYNVTGLQFTGTNCTRRTEPQQNGWAVADFNGDTLTGLRILTQGSTSVPRSNTVFLGTRKP